MADQISEETMAKFSSNFVKKIYSDTQKAQQTPKRTKKKKIILKFIIVKILKTKDKERIIKGDRGEKKRHITYKGTKVQMIAESSSEIIETRKQ